MAIKILTLLTLFTFLFFSTSVTSISTHDLDALLTLLRANGHSLFANAISTSDLLFDLLSLPSLTLLAPTDPSLFALDMTQTPSFYLSTLRLHALPRRLSWSSFLLLPNGSSLPTLLPSRQLRLTRRDGANVVLVVSTIGGGAVQLVMPGLFYSSHVAVHGLAGILTFRFKTGGGGEGGGSGSHPNRTVFLPPVTRFPFTPPRIPDILPANRTNNHSSPVNCTVLSSLVPTDHVSPVNRTVVSAPVPTEISNHTYHVSPVLKHTVVSPRVNNSTVSPWPNPSDSSPAPVPGLDANGAPKLRKNGDVATGISSEFVVSPGGVENQKEW